VIDWVTAGRPRPGKLLARFSAAVLAPVRRPARPALLQRAPGGLLGERPDLRRSLGLLGRPPGPQSGPFAGPDLEGRADHQPAPLVRVGAAAGWALCGLALIAVFLRVSRTVPVNSDGAANALQAWAMLHGNLLLHGWLLSDVSFYTTELPQYMLIELTRGLSPDVVHVAAAMTYTFVVLLAARLAKGSATGTLGLLRAGIAAGIMVAPQHSEVVVLMLSPDHVGSTVPVLLAWLLIDRARRRWYVPLAAAVLLAWALVADPIVLLTGVAPVIIVGLALAYQRVIIDRGPVRSGGYGLALALAGVAAAEAGSRALALIRSHGGFYVFPVTDHVVRAGQLPGNLLQTFHGLLLLFGADFLGQRPGLSLAIALVHLAGLGLAGWGLCAALHRLTGGEPAVLLLALGTLVSITAYAFGPNAHEALSSREFAAVLPFGAALAGRLLAARLRRDRLIPVLLAVLAVYAAGVFQATSRPPVPGQNQALADWLVAHQLSYGLGGYWMANSVTLDSGGAVRLAPVKGKGTVWPFSWEDEPDWFNPDRHVANFLVLPADGTGPPPGPGSNPPSVANAIATFGPPAKAYFLADYTVLVWTSNLLTAMQHR